MRLTEPEKDRTRGTHYDARGAGLQLRDVSLADRPADVDTFGRVLLHIGLRGLAERKDGQGLAVLLDRDVDLAESPFGRFHHQLEGRCLPDELVRLPYLKGRTRRSSRPDPRAEADDERQDEEHTEEFQERTHPVIIARRIECHSWALRPGDTWANISRFLTTSAGIV